jgi:hypothetical protein
MKIKRILGSVDKHPGATSSTYAKRIVWINNASGLPVFAEAAGTGDAYAFTF